MANFFKKIKEAGLDKWLHFVACFCICAVFSIAFFGIGGYPKANCGAIGWIAAVCCGIAKEVWDFFHNEKFDAKDLLWDIAGATVAFPLAFLM